MRLALLGLALATVAGPALAQDGPPPAPHGGMMMRADANHDGVITRDEFLAQAAERFDRMDANHDGKLTQDELGRMGQHMRGMHGGGDMPPPPPAQPPQ